MKIRVRNARIAYTQNLWVPGARNENEKPAWSSTFILEGQADHEVEYQVADGTKPDGTAKFKWVGGKKMSQVLAEVAAAKWGAKGATTLNALKLKGDICYRNGDTKPESDGFEGNMFLSGRNPNTAPVVLNALGQPTDQSDGIVYSGCYVHAVLDIYPQDNKYGKRINCGIQTVMFSKDGEAFGGGVRGSASDFDDLTLPFDADDFGGMAD